MADEIDRNRSSTDEPLPLEEALDWFVRLQADGAGPAERAAFTAWHGADPRHARAWALTEAMWASPTFARALEASAPAPRATTVGRRGVGRRLAACAAALLVAVGVGWALDLPLRLQADHRTATGGRASVALADGSRVLLDTRTALADDVDGVERHARLLEGTAFFEVAPDSTRPFQVAAGPATVTVVGTAFAVRYVDGRVTVTVREGVVEVHGTPPGPVVRLRPGEQVEVTDGGIGESRKVDLTASLAWMDGWLVFEDRPLGAVLAELDRYHPGVIVVPAGLAGVRVTGSYRLDDPVRTTAMLAGLVHAEVRHFSDALLVLRPGNPPP
ncbi:FecR family protein [Azospirillum sp. RWY-5-1]|uniref:FecR family protein n=1 Tax=Azospirillum oleiclasticum TaxID=2735135 RepID=A0ABX2T773_9PROT|nr:FecR family protein [Azospirillum oleiclasticum]NYZ13153.1 FecR family protein [Azospirillum oleiclasticum]NYZ20174.1 FecR family protein [Azospirillum oleiclasticum]